ncbi:MAG: menaquinol oxidoreductase [Actinobacteria bacterium]|nr:MAG: menaquinol oxidoreductase [Actinomycetota bacterium]
MINKIKASVLTIIVIVVSVFMGKSFLNRYIFAEVQPVQPIKFNHRSHVTNNKIPCKYCHIYAKRSNVSGVPSVERCMGCHSSIKNVKNDKGELKKLVSHWENKKPIAWTKVYNLADYIYFSHRSHITVAKIDCKECHGDVAKMDTVRRVPNINMGWCLHCHSDNNGPTGDCWGCHQ